VTTRVAQQQVHNPVSPFTTRWLPRVGFPTFQHYYEDTKTTRLLLAPLRVTSWRHTRSALMASLGLPSSTRKGAARTMFTQMPYRD